MNHQIIDIKKDARHGHPFRLPAPRSARLGGGLGFENYERYVHATHKRQRRLWNVA